MYKTNNNRQLVILDNEKYCNETILIYWVLWFKCKRLCRD